MALRFRLQRVLEFRRWCVTRLEHDLQTLASRLRQEESRLAELQHERQGQQEYVLTLPALRGDDLQMWRRYDRQLEEHISQQQGVVQEAAQALRVKQQELVSARQEEKMLADLEEKARQRHRLTLARHEQQLLDEIAITRARYGH
jgi:flagellar export protein FliJ